METFEVHITGNEDILKLPMKTIGVELLRPDGSVLRTEYMTSLIYRYPSFNECLEAVNRLLPMIKDIIRVKIETPFYLHYVKDSLYMESHFSFEDWIYPVSRNVEKINMLSTDRTYDKSKYKEFRALYKDVELCLYDTFVEEDKDWFDLYTACLSNG